MPPGHLELLMEPFLKFGGWFGPKFFEVGIFDSNFELGFGGFLLGSH